MDWAEEQPGLAFLDLIRPDDKPGLRFPLTKPDQTVIGREGPNVQGRDEGYLFSFAWLAHQSVSLFSSQDANGVFRPLVLGGTCNTLTSSLPISIIPLSPLYDTQVCGGPAGRSARASVEKALKVKEGSK